MSAPTPGPYFVRRHWSNGCEVCPSIVDGDGRWIADAVGAPHLGHPETLPTAALLAAAWELREACRKAMLACQDNLKMYAYKNEPALMEAFEACKTAIAKADGEGVAHA